MTILGYIKSAGRRDKTEISGKHLFRERSSGSVQFNDMQYFGNVPLNAWEFYIGGYQPAQKWLKDRCGRTLSIEEIQHYQKIIVALVETERVMNEVNQLDLLKEQ